MKKKILCDLHHEQLYVSIQKLADRLDANVYRPMGHEWFSEGVWQLVTEDDPHWDSQTVNQFLGPENYQNFPGVLHRDAIDTSWDYIISSIPRHGLSFEKWRKKYSPKAYHLFQIGNQWSEAEPGIQSVLNILNSTSTNFSDQFHSVKYHPEFEYSYQWPRKLNTAASFLHYPHQEHVKLMDRLRELLPEWSFMQYGGGAADGAIPMVGVADMMARYAFVIHHKPMGDGYGFLIHQAVASGRPMVLNVGDYSNKSVGPSSSHGYHGLVLVMLVMQMLVFRAVR